MIHPRSLSIDEPRTEVPRWWCSNCRAEVEGPWHEAVCPMPDVEVGS